MSNFLAPISELIWDAKYRYRLHGKIVDHTLEQTWQRVAKAIAAAEKVSNQAGWEQAFNRILADFRFLPGGRILAGAGTKHTVTLFNCFVMDIAEDSLEGIFNALKEGAVTLQQGGGVGYDFSVLRPKGEVAKHRGVATSGPVSFMHIWDSMCKVILSTGARRGAMMGVLRCDHPDIEEFIDAKKDPAALRHFNVSVMVTDAFMQAVQEDGDWPLVFPANDPHAEVYRVVKARALWQKVIRSAYEYAEPGVLFYDTINRQNNLNYIESIEATNPCGEIPLPPYGACDLGAINLTRFIRDPFTPKATIDWQALEETVSIATRFLDNVIDVSHYPLNAERQQALQTRRIGLGITGLGDALVMLGLRYGSPPSIEMAKTCMQRIADVTWETSIELAREKGSFPLFDPRYLQGNFVKKLPEALQTKIAAHGVRNSHHNTVAPTGTISLLANNISNGIEPIFNATYTRKVHMPNGNIEAITVHDFAYQLWRKEHSAAMPAAWVDVNDLTPADHLAVQNALQPYIDNAISKTINLPAGFPFENLQEIYSRAYQLGLKGCTIFRPNEITGSVLECCDQAQIVLSKGSNVDT